MNFELPGIDLLNLCINGDKDTWDLFVEKYTDLVYHAIHKTLKMYCPNFLYQDLEDIHNSIFLSLIENDYRRLRQYQGINGCTVASWLMVIATNSTLNFIKRNKISISLDDPSGDDQKNSKDIVQDLQPSVIDRISESEQSELLRELIEGLNPDDKLFLKYCFEDELQPEEIAKIMNISVSAIYSRKSRIIDKLRKIAKKKNLLQEK
ncbi:MAG: sigma-70 family RNA polymerase sigma factor [Nitrospirae bacterium]|nr:sigma-70 family RNA polymerase sigma factor [Nitrospirota bacterium]